MCEHNSVRTLIDAGQAARAGVVVYDERTVFFCDGFDGADFGTFSTLNAEFRLELRLGKERSYPYRTFLRIVRLVVDHRTDQLATPTPRTETAIVGEVCHSIHPPVTLFYLYVIDDGTVFKQKNGETGLDSPRSVFVLC